jgi:hypothetical protein
VNQLCANLFPAVILRPQVNEVRPYFFTFIHHTYTAPSLVADAKPRSKWTRDGKCALALYILVTLVYQVCTENRAYRNQHVWTLLNASDA